MWRSVGLSPENWSASSEEGRLASLQVLEMQIAESEGRAARQVDTHRAKENDRGGFDPDQPDKISINEKLLRQDDPREAVRTVAHEGRHAYQLDCINDPDNHTEVSKETRSEWANNLDNYKVPEKDYEGYRSQPVEADARAFENKVVDQLYSSKETGLDVDKARPQDVASKGGNDDLIPGDRSPPEAQSLAEAKAEAKASLKEDKPPPPPPPPPPSQGRGMGM